MAPLTKELTLPRSFLLAVLSLSVLRLAWIIARGVQSVMPGSVYLLENWAGVTACIATPLILSLRTRWHVKFAALVMFCGLDIFSRASFVMEVRDAVENGIQFRVFNGDSHAIWQDSLLSEGIPIVLYWGALLLIAGLFLLLVWRCERSS